MLRSAKSTILNLIKKTGWEFVKSSVINEILHGLPLDSSPAHLETYDKVKSFTMTTPQRVISFCNAVDYIEKNNIPGAIVTCGVWRGGIPMAAIDTLNKFNNQSRDIHLYDTFEGMTTVPSEFDVKALGHTGSGQSAADLYRNADVNNPVFCYSSLDEAKKNLGKMDYPADKVHYIKGFVEDTIPQTKPDKIALLYLNVCFYKPVLHALNHLYPLLEPGAVLFIGDYGGWEGTKKAVDEFIVNNKIKLLLNRIDEAGRIGVKV